MIATALEAEVDEYVASFTDEVDEDGRRLVVRNGRGKQRRVTVGSGTLPLRAPRLAAAGWGVVAGRVVACARGGPSARPGARAEAVHDRCGADPVRAGRQPGVGSALQARRRGVGELGRRDPRLDGMDEDQCYRAMDLLIEADAEARVQEAVFFACADLLNLEVDLLFFDTTSTSLRA